MPVATGTNLANVTALLDAVRAELVLRNWTVRRNTLNVGTNSGELWLEKAAGDTKNGERLVVGMQRGSDVSGFHVCELRQTHLDWATASAGGANAWINVTGMNISQRPKSTHFSTGANFLRHWIITPPTAGASPADHQYCHVVAEIGSGIYRTFSFGEVIKIGTWSGGQYIEGSWIDHLESPTYTGQGYFATCDSATANEFHKGVIYNTSAPTSDKYVRLAPGRDASVTHCFGFGPRMFGEDLIDLSPAPFSGNTQRLPAQIYMAETANLNTSNITPIAQIPDVFHANIRDLDPGTVIVDDTFRFLVVPHYAKTGTNTSGNYGVLIRNPAL